MFEALEHAAEYGRKSALCMRKGFKQLTVLAHTLSDRSCQRVAVSFTALSSCNLKLNCLKAEGGNRQKLTHSGSSTLKLGCLKAEQA